MFLFSCLLACGAPGPGGGSGLDDTHTAATDTVDTADSGPGPEALSLPAGAASHLVWISLDTLRRDALGRYGGAETPFLDGLLSDGVSLDGHRSCTNWTLPAMLCQFMGRSPLDAGFYPGFNPDDTSRDSPEGLTTLATALNTGGFQAAWLSANPLLSDALPDLARPEALTIREHEVAKFLTAEALVLAGALDQNSERWSLMVHYTDTHTPYVPPDSYLDALDLLEPCPVDLTDKSVLIELDQGTLDLSDAEMALVLAHLEARYAGAVQYLDDELAALWEGLASAGLLGDTLVVVSSDHGEQFFEHGLFSHGRALHAEEVDAIAGFWLDGLEPAAWSGPTLAEDVGVTVAHLLGLDPLPDATGALVGTRSSQVPGHAFFLGRIRVPAHVLDLDGWRLLYDWEGTTALYDVVADPGEQVDLAASEPEALAEMTEALQPFMAQAQAVFPDLEPAEARTGD